MQALRLQLQEIIPKPSEVTPIYLQCVEVNSHGQSTLLDREYETQDIVQLQSRAKYIGNLLEKKV